MPFANQIMYAYLSLKYGKIENCYRHPHHTQRQWFNRLISHGMDTRFGKKHDFRCSMTPDDYRTQVPIQDYNSLKKQIRQMMHGQPDVLWPGTIHWFSKSSGTTQDRSKFLPVSAQSLNINHILGFSCSLALLYQHYGIHAKLFSGKSLTMGGSIEPFKNHPKSFVGDISAIILHNMPSIGKYFYALDEQIALLDDWEEKINRAAVQLVQEPTIRMIGGVPTWNIVLFKKMLSISGKKNMLEIWPGAKCYIHGGVNFRPYYEQFKNFFPTKNFIYQEIYNASEGFFAAQDRFDSDDMLLMLDHGVYYEFLPLDELNKKNPNTLHLSEVKKNTPYALVLTTNSGLWRYQIGDVIRFTTLNPYRIQIVGRTKHYINVFGEELMVHNTNKALEKACKTHQVQIVDYTVAPVFLNARNKGAHQWLIEFVQEPNNISQFAKDLDSYLQQINSDYAAKRHKNLVLEQLHLSVLPKGSFHAWMKKNQKYGAQNKTPRLFNTRKYLEQIIAANPPTTTVKP